MNHNRLLRSTRASYLLILYAFLSGCERPATVTFTGTVREREGITASYSVPAPDANPEFKAISNATITVIAPKSMGDAVLYTVKSDDKGHFIIKCTSRLPDGARLIATSENHQPLEYNIDKDWPSYVRIGFILKIITRV